MGVISLQAGNPMAKVGMSVLIFEALCAALSIAVMINVEQLPPLWAWLAGGAVTVLALLATAMLRRPAVGFALGWLTQAATLGLGLLTPGMFIIGGMFAALWVLCFILGRRLEARSQSASSGQRR